MRLRTFMLLAGATTLLIGSASYFVLSASYRADAVHRVYVCAVVTGHADLTRQRVEADLAGDDYAEKTEIMLGIMGCAP